VQRVGGRVGRSPSHVGWRLHAQRELCVALSEELFGDARGPLRGERPRPRAVGNVGALEQQLRGEQTRLGLLGFEGAR
jgi:hypothetical protein